ncbi:MAG: VWA domain-containing protein [Bacteroidota bacterium]
MPISRQTSLAANIVGFCRHLRQHQFTIGPGEASDALNGILVLEAVNDPYLFREALKAVLTKSQKERRRFDELYANYWKELSKAVDSKTKDVAETSNTKGKSSRKRPPSLTELKQWLFGNKNTEQAEMAVYSPGAALGQKDLSGIPRKGLEEIIQAIYEIARVLATKNNRRYRPSKTPGAFDVRNTLRRNMRSGGEIIHLSFRKPQQKKLNIVLLCDVSRSMDLYSRFLIQLMFGFQSTYRNIETFVFSTTIQRVTRQLATNEFDTALTQLSDEVNQWSGGTRIGESLNGFVNDYGKRMLTQRTVVVILSDGMDNGDTDILKESLATINRKSACLIWLNPLAGKPGYKPKVKGMKAALPYIDLFAGVHNTRTLQRALKRFKIKGKQKRLTLSP